MALLETLKLTFNISKLYPDTAASFGPAIRDIVKILIAIEPFAGPLLDPTIAQAINVLMNLPFETDLDAIFPSASPIAFTQRQIEVLDFLLNQCREEELDTQVAPVVVLLRKTYEHAPPSVKEYIQDRLLPSNSERERPLGRSDSLSARLLKLFVSARSPHLRELVPTLLFEASNKDPETFVHNVGYGYASGYLTNHQLPIPETKEARNGAAVDDDDTDPDINFVTGQFLASEPPQQADPMTEEEKLREAERLFILFER